MTELRESFRKSVKHRKCGIKEPLSVVPREENHQPRHGVRITGLTEQGVATRDGMLAVDDLIVEVRVVSYSFNFSVQKEKVTFLQRGWIYNERKRWKKEVNLTDVQAIHRPCLSLFFFFGAEGGICTRASHKRARGKLDVVPGCLSWLCLLVLSPIISHNS